jgi:Arc/MetJ-type ribon-helix-helix transcriptional regulator
LKTIQVEIPDKLAQALEAIVKAGWCQSEAEAVRLAILELVRGHRLDLQERFQREDISWAVQQGAKPE